MRLQGKVAVVTGASRGIGKAIASRFSGEGSKLVLAARDGAKLNEVSAELSVGEREVITAVADVSKESDVANMIKAAIETYGRIDILVNNAGFGIFKPVVDMSAAEFDSLFNVNMRGTFLATREVLPYMMKQRDGVIINIASLAGKNAVENGAVYAATKWAMLGFAKSLMLEVRKYNIRVVTICPGSVSTEFGSGHNLNSDKMLRPDDVAEAAVLAAGLPVNAMMSEIDLRPTNPK